ncbi:MAG: amidohydrolase [Clostridia bacterium]|nr:amidohydrolase [Clostridia bacterium]MDE7215689.1 amidohydrolase [Clostridia bacterium]
MMIRIYNAKILTPDGVIDGGELWIEDGKIKLVSQVSPLILLPWDREINAKGNLLMPSFKNSHAHSPMVFLRSYADDMSLSDWLFKQVFPREAKLTPDDCYWLTKLAILEYLSSGISVASDMYFHLESIADACVDCGFRNVILEGITDGNKPDLYKKLQWGMDTLDGKGGLVEYRLGLHAEYTNSEECIKMLAGFAKENKMPVYTHLCETKKEVDECVARHGKTPGEYLSDMGLFDYGGVAYHFVHPSEKDIKALRERNVSVVTCPASNLKLASGIAPIHRLVKEGFNVAIGTDGAASNNALDMFREMFLATGLQKGTLGDPAVVSGDSVLDMATVNGAKAMGLQGFDGLEIGQNADIVMIDLHKPNMQPLNNIAKNLVFAGSKSNVAMTIVAGKILYENGEYSIGEDADKIYSQCNKITDRILER